MILTYKRMPKRPSKEELIKWDKEHRDLLDRIAPEEFEVLHYAAVTVLKVRDN